MREYIEAIGYFMVLAAFVSMLVQDKFRREVNFILGIIMLLVICEPLENLFEKKYDFATDYTTDDITQYQQLQQEIFSQAIIYQLEQKIQQQTGARRVSVSLNADNTVKNVLLYGATENDRQITAQLCGTGTDAVEIMD